MSTESTQPDSQKYWHCDFCHRGLTARDIHDITDHKIRCYTCAALGAPEPEPKPDPKTTDAESWDDLLGAFTKPAPKPADVPPQEESALDQCYRQAFMLWGMLVGRGSLPVPNLSNDKDWKEVDLAVAAIMEGLALIDGIPFKDE